MAFTRGPWKIRLKDECQLPIWGPDGRIVCIVSSGYDDDLDRGPSNADLILAAPDMYNALSDIYDFLKRSGYDTRIVDGVLRKAEGK